ncbi:MAG: cadherin repeat domain-containing protein, partial [Psychrobium sp.]|nr:cadherin repeat domain-containing protein [Psychrobium sp.]
DTNTAGDAATNLVSENANAGTQVGITAFATDVGDTVTYSLSDNPGNLFFIDGLSGVVRLLGSLDYSVATSHDIIILATSSDGSTSSQIFTVNVGDNNTGAGAGIDIGEIIDANTTASLVSENAIIGTEVGITANAVDVDPTDTVTYSLSNDALGLFSIDSNSGVVTLANTLDFETLESHSIIVVATSSDGSSSSKTFVIDVGDNDTGLGGGGTGGDSTNPVGPVTDVNTTIFAATNLISENAVAGTEVGITAQATDIDLGDIVTYSLDDDANGLFNIDSSTGVVTLVGTLDYETDTSHNITVLATSKDGSTSNATFIIAVGDNDVGAGGGSTGGDNTVSIGPVTDSNEVGNALTNLVSENAAPGTAVGITAIATDVGDSVTYSLISNPGNLFFIDGSSGVVILLGNLDSTVAISHDIEILATSSDGSTSSEVFTVTVGENNTGAGGGDDIGDITDSDDAVSVVSENAMIGTNVGITASATDPDGSDTVSYSLSEDAGGLFSIDSNSGVVSLANSLDYETAQLHTINVVAASSDGSSSSEEFTIAVGDNDTGIGGGTGGGDNTDAVGAVTDIDITDDALINLVS